MEDKILQMDIIHLQSIDSTQSFAKKNAHTFSPTAITCIVADRQTAGKGKFQRPWHSPPDVNLYATFYFRLDTNAAHLTSLSNLLSVSLAKVLIQEGFIPQIKWPNDIQLSGKKVAGILCETIFQPQEIEIFLGIGINVNMEKEEFFHIDQPATSLKIELGYTYKKEVLLEKLYVQFSQDLAIFKIEGFSPFFAFYNEHLANKGKIDLFRN